eukprot:7484457-Karenia_brevis.AAC.1
MASTPSIEEGSSMASTTPSHKLMASSPSKEEGSSPSKKKFLRASASHYPLRGGGMCVPSPEFKVASLPSTKE